jgi:hypothetical protein
MSLDPIKFFKACNPNKTLVLSNENDQRYYIDFTKARSGKRSSVSLIDELYRTITRSDDSSHQLFTGHIGCGKSTELLKLQHDLERDGFHVVYLDSSEDLVMTDVDISDILLTIARQVSKSLLDQNIHLDPEAFREFYKKPGKFSRAKSAYLEKEPFPVSAKSLPVLLAKRQSILALPRSVPNSAAVPMPAPACASTWNPKPTT